MSCLLASVLEADGSRLTSNDAIRFMVEFDVSAARLDGCPRPLAAAGAPTRPLRQASRRASNEGLTCCEAERIAVKLDSGARGCTERHRPTSLCCAMRMALAHFGDCREGFTVRRA
jgi:hypothetical protein